ncbi:MAG: YqeG family HAD IIIA-type phosphatase [Clostridia bacterium]|nr:YqeG family HAD IIIA-type phosphatase [Clostridia bacterium]
MRNVHKKKLFPDYYAIDVSLVTPDFIRACGCTAVLVDIDNTLSRVDAPEATPLGGKWMADMKATGIPFAFISNNDPPRVELFSEKYGAPFICHAEKPKPDGYRALAKQLGHPVEKCMMVGDQLFTDILGGNNAGMCTVLVAPVCEWEDPVDFRLRRKMEKILVTVDNVFCSKKRLIGG